MAGTELATAYVSLVASTSGMSKDINKALGGAEKSADKSGKKMGGLMAGGIASKLGTLAKGAGLVGAGVAAGQALMGGFKSAINTQNTEASLTGLYGSAEDAADMIRRIGEVSRKSPIDTKSYESAAVSLAYLGVKGEDSQNILRNVGLAITAAGGDSQQIDQATNALTNMVNEGKVTRETLNQLSGAGVPVFSALADAMGVTSDELSGIIQKGGVELDDVLGVLENGTGDLFQQMIAGGKETEQTFGNTWKRVKDQFVQVIGKVLLPVLKGVQPVLSGISSGIEWVSNALSGASGPGDKFAGVFQAIGDGARDVWSWIQTNLVPMFTSLWNDTIYPVFTQVKDLVVGVFRDSILPVLQRVWETIQTNVLPTLQALWTNVVQPVFTQIGALVSAVWNGILHPILTMLAAVLQNVVAPVVMWLWQNVIGPAFQAIGAIIQFVWQNVISPVMTVITAVLRNVGGVFSWFYTSIIQPVWNAVGTAISWVWVNIIQPTWNALKAALNAVGLFFQWIWNSIIKPTWDALGAGIRWVWENVIRPAWDALKAALNAVGLFFQWVWNSIIKPAWDALGTGIRWVIDNVIKPAWDGMKTALQSVADFFGNVVDGIRIVWDKLKGYLATPINFLIGVVWNKGILAAWNKVAEFLPGLNPAQPLSQLAEGHQFATGGAVSGPGGPTSDSIAARLSHGEHVFDAGDVKALGGQRAVYALRALIDRGIPFTWDTVKGLAAMPMASIQSMKNAPQGTDIIGGLNPETIPGFADGGAPTEPAWKAQLENGHRAAKMRNGNPYTWGFEDCSGYMSMIADAIINGGDGVRRWATSSFPGGQPWVPGLGEGFSVGVHDNPGGPGGGHTAGTLTGVGPYATVNVESGGAHGDVAYGGPAAGADDPQWDGVSPGRFHLAIGADGAFESAGPGGVDKAGFLVKKIHEIIEKLIGPIKGGISAAIGDPPPEWLGIPPEFLDLATHGVTDFLVDKIGSLGDLLGSVYNKAKDLASDVLHVVSFGLFDNGGWLQPGMNLIANKTGRPEPVLNPEQWRLMEQLLESMTGGKPLDMDHLADVAATFQKSTEDALQNAGKSFLDDAFGVVGFPGFDRWTKVGDEYQKALEARRKMDEDKRKQEAEANKPKDEATAESPVVPIEQQPTTTGTYQDPQYGDPTVVKGTEAVELDKMPDISSGGGAGGDAVAAVKRAFEPYGWSTGDMWSAAEWIIGKESSWNPTARNPSSGAFGLFQFLGSTKDQYLPDENPDPYIQGQAGARYIQDRYGNPMNAKAFWEQNGWYDNGGWLQPGLTLVENRTGRPEPVFSPQQWATLEANINTGGGAGGGPRTVIRQEVTVADQKSAVRELSRQARRDMMVHGG